MVLNFYFILLQNYDIMKLIFVLGIVRAYGMIKLETCTIIN